MFKILVEYDGTGLCGWQKQLEGDSVQEFLECAIFNLTNEKVEVNGAGRTDAGVHAYAMCASVDVKKEISEYNFVEGINFHLRELKASVCVLSAELVDGAFHARFSAKSRSYVYRIVNRRAPLVVDKDRAWHVSQKLDVEKMREAGQYFIGNHDFTSFRAAACQALSPVKTLDVFEVNQLGDEIKIYVKAKSFLHNQVRNMVGAVKEVGVGRFEPEDIKKILDYKDRKKAPVCAPACGLYFYNVEY
ncbi:MAG: tRNA pseudouridine(38-40) synthase TruA [Alphaproteobacteria bacterium]